MSLPRPDTVTAAPTGALPGLTVQATAAFVLAAVVNSLVHECAHAAAALAYGLTPTVISFAVDVAEPTTRTQEIVIALAGPVASLVIGLVLGVVARNWGRGFGRLFFLWLWSFAVMNFVGYCIIAPFARGGDTGQALELLAVPGWVPLLVAAVGVAGQFLLARRFAVEVKRYTANLTQERQLAFKAWALGTPVIVVATLAELLIAETPALHFAPVLAYSVAVGIFAPMQFLFSGRVTHRREPLELDPGSRSGVVAAAVAVLVSVVLVATGGVTW